MVKQNRVRECAREFLHTYEVKRATFATSSHVFNCYQLILVLSLTLFANVGAKLGSNYDSTEYLKIQL